MSKTGKLSPIKKTYSQAFKTLESSLAAHGYYRAPGTSRTFTPYKEKSGVYRTGLDINAKFLQRLGEEAYKDECERIKDYTERLKKHFPGIDLSPSSNVWNPFSNADVKVNPVRVGNNDEYFDLDSGSGLLNYVWVRVHPQIASSYEAYKRGEYPDAQYYMADEEAETKLVYSRKKEINKAIVYFEQMTPSRKKQVARLMGLPIGDDTTEETVYNEMDNLLKQSEFKEGEYKGLSTIRIFNDISQLGDDKLKVKDIVEQALRHSLYRLGVGGKVVEGNNTIAASKEELVAYLLEDEHQMDLLALQKRLDEKKFANVA